MVQEAERVMSEEDEIKEQPLDFDRTPTTTAAERQKLLADMEAFLRSGGKITQCQPGESRKGKTKWHPTEQHKENAVKARNRTLRQKKLYR